MIAKISLILCACVVMTKAGAVNYVAPAYRGVVAAAQPVPIFTDVAKVAVDIAPRPYDFGYSLQTEDGATAHRQETSDGVNKQGSYGYTGPDGVYRQVEYIADAAGFRATIRTNEHGTANQNPASTSLVAEQPPYNVLPAAVKAAAVVHPRATPVYSSPAIKYL